LIIEDPGYVTDRILLLGRRESCVYLLKGEGEYAILGGGMAYIVPDIIRQLEEYEIDESRIKRIIILHSHFDHCGIVPFFKRRWPGVEVTASERAKNFLSTKKVIDNIEFLNQILLMKHGIGSEEKELDLSFSGVDVGSVVKDGDILFCGDLSMEIIEVPGHSSCSIAVYVREEKAMFASDAGGVPFGDQVFTAANSNYDKYVDSLHKMGRFETEIHVSEHYGARTGRDGRYFIQKSIDSARGTRRILEESIARTKDIKASTKEITEMLTKDAPVGFIPKEVISMVTEQMLRYLSVQRGAIF
jgi:glyoxylase-like metal-dependent hydrolase (beta-lactamase superfamily II)